MKTLPNYTLLTAAIALLASMNSVASETTIAVTAENFSHAETARNYRNWAAQGANKGFVILERVMGTAFRAKPVDIAAFRKSSPRRYPHGYPQMDALTPLLRATQSSVVRAVQSQQC